MSTDTAIKPLEVVDILSSSWGWEQTNVDFYIVLRVTAKSAWIQKVGAKRAPGTPEGFMTAYVIPDPDRTLSDDVTMHRIRPASATGYRGPTLRLTSYSDASLWDGEPERTSCYA